MATTISPNPAYLYGMQATARKLADHASERKTHQALQGRALRLPLPHRRGPVPFPRPGRANPVQFLVQWIAGEPIAFHEGSYHAFLNENDRFSAQIGTFRYTARRNTAMVGFTKRQAALFAAEDPALFEDVMTAEHLSFLQLSYRLALGKHSFHQQAHPPMAVRPVPYAEARRRWFRRHPSNMTLEGMSDFLNVAHHHAEAAFWHRSSRKGCWNGEKAAW